MTNNDTSTKAWQDMDSAHHIHPFNDPKTLAAAGPQIITKADDIYVWDNDGNKILDGMAGLWCVNVGYGRKELVQVASKQMEELPFYNSFFQSSTPTQIQLAERLAEITPGDLNHIFFANSGSEANDTVIRLVRHYWQKSGQPTKHIFIGRNLAYHGSTIAATSLGGMDPMRAFGNSPLPGFEHIPEPHWYVHGQNQTLEEFGLSSAKQLEDKILELGADNVAAFIGEPIQGAGGVIDPPMSYWPEIERICKKHNILLVADEVICGFGRTGEWFGCQTYGFEPDVMPMAKGISSGYLPISAVAFNTRVFDVLNDGGPILHGYTYSGHPVACAVALENIEIIERENLIEIVREETAPYLHECLAQLANQFPIIGEVRGKGLIAGLQLVKDRATREPFSAETNIALKCRDYCLSHGLIMRAIGQSMILCPPLTITKTQIDELIEKASLGLKETSAFV